MTSLSVLVPVYNEQHLVAASLERLLVLETSPLLTRIQVVVVDDGSTDDTPAHLHQLEGRMRQRADGRIDWTFLRHPSNRGKGHAVRTAIAHAECAVSVFHDADLEYDPADLLPMLELFERGQADAVFGSRFAGAKARRALMFRHEIGNRFLTLLTNLVTNVNLTDMETCYKAVRTDLLKSLPLVSNDFRIEPELTIKLAKRQCRIFEVPISYSGRTYQEGKKVNWRDGAKAIGAIARFGVSDKIYRDDEYGSQMLGRLAQAPRFNAWMAQVIAPHCGQRVLEIGSGPGNLTRTLTPRQRYVASDINPLYLETLRGLLSDRPYLDVTLTDVSQGTTFPKIEGGFDTVICLNVIEHVDDDVGALRNIREVLAPEGRALVLVPQGPELMGTLDEVLGHRRRYTPESLEKLAQGAGFEIRQLIFFNRVGRPAWWLNGKLLRRRDFGRLQVLALNTLTPVFKRIDDKLPFEALSLIAVMAPIQVGPRGA